MGLNKLASKVDEYRKRLKEGKASKIKASHVKKVSEKLQKKTKELEDEIATTKNSDKKARLKKKLAIAREHEDRAEWLLKEIG